MRGKDDTVAVHAAVSGAARSARRPRRRGRGAARIVPDAVADRDEIGARGHERPDLVEAAAKPTQGIVNSSAHQATRSMIASNDGRRPSASGSPNIT